MGDGTRRDGSGQEPDSVRLFWEQSLLLPPAVCCTLFCCVPGQLEWSAHEPSQGGSPTTAVRPHLARPSAGQKSGTERARHLCRKAPQIRRCGAGRGNGTAHRRKTMAASSGLRQKIPRRGRRRGSLMRSKINGRYRVDTGLISARAPGRASGSCRASPEG